MTGKNLHRGERLDGLAEAHLVADQGTPGARGEQCAGTLVGIERDFQQCRQPRTVGALWVGVGEGLSAYLGVADFGNVGERVLIAA